MDQLNSLTAVSPVDGRYRNKISSLTQYFSEFALIQYRLRVEVEYFIALCELPLPQLASVSSEVFPALRKIYEDFSLEDAQRIKEIEKTTNHDVKAVEYFIKEHFDKIDISETKEFIHFGLTSQDINNTAIPLSLKEAVEHEYLPLLKEITTMLEGSAREWKSIPMLARTHGQPASPTRLGKEIEVFIARLKSQVEILDGTIHAAKFGGATGGFNAHYVAFPDHDWHKFADQFVNEKLGLKRSFPTTQIEHYDHMASLFDVMKRINTILIDLSRDIWTYISINYFSQKIQKDEVGSSAMPHKVNPIDFENAEGNLGMANKIFGFLSEKLPVSRLQRDLTDSTVLRNVGVPFSHSLIAFKSLLKGWGKLQCNEDVIKADLEDNWAVVSEAIQTILRRESYPSPYEALKALTRKNEKITQSSIHEFISGLDVSEEIKEELRAITPFNYVGR